MGRRWWWRLVISLAFDDSSDSVTKNDHPARPLIRLARGGCFSSAQVFDLHSLEPAIAAVIPESQAARAWQLADGDVAELVSRSVGSLSGLVPLVKIDR